MKKAAFRQPFFIFNSPFSIIFCLCTNYQQNSNKIYQLNDMDVEDVIHISYLLEFIRSWILLYITARVK